LAAGLRWGSLQRSPRPTSWIKGSLLLREGRGGNGGEGIEGGKEGGKGRKGEGRGKGKGKQSRVLPSLQSYFEHWWRANILLFSSMVPVPYLAISSPEIHRKSHKKRAAQLVTFPKKICCIRHGGSD